ncbi:DUF4126 family protein [Mucilaginibacter aquaedulcis]|uniref:DUF4126 family protein n=1 Tax=Mucilaginibacter aquaedulcis TaxID=1187081 RepID=UPI0025B44384|nr:DUF4126 family protein [Mucilaginibacter aquaedulcis]MDN3547759.1 DUF4126 family protein [Mucilaginibacter aquaedulcis]
MQLKISKPLWQVIGLGTLAGMRSTSAPAITSHILSHHQSKNLEHSPLGFMQSKNVAAALKVLALGEIVGDKLPSAPNRIKPAALGFRVISGALAGAGIYRAVGNNAIVGALLGGTAAFASTYGSFFLRRSTVKTSHIIDPIIGAVEDALVIGSGVGLASLS